MNLTYNTKRQLFFSQGVIDMFGINVYT